MPTSSREDFVNGLLTQLRLKDEGVDSRVIEFLGKIGTGVIDYRRQEWDPSPEIQEFQRDVVEAFRKFAPDLTESFDEAQTPASIELAHRAHDDQVIFLDLDRESAGTRRLLVLLGNVFQALDTGTLFLVDELDASLHTQACEAVLAMFSSPSTNPNRAQMVATTHDTNLLRSRLLRRDQVWFTEKDTEGATHLYPLTDIRTRKGDNIAKGYLQGRYGAIPFAGRIGDITAAR